MTTEQARAVLEHPDRLFVLSALSFVNLGDEEQEVLIYRYMRKHTQEETAEKRGVSVNHIYGVQKTALQKCAKVWGKMAFIRAAMGE